MLETPAYERLVEALRRLPGVGKRSAERLALHLLCAPADDAHELSAAIRHARDVIGKCSECGHLTETEPCAVCRDPRRDRELICVVERPVGVMAIEKGGSYRGLYHVLHGVLSPLEGVGPDDINVEALMARLQRGGVKEVILATNTTAEGEATAMYLSRRITAMNVPVSRIAHGVPMGGGLEFADDVTLAHALEGRTRLE